MYRHMKSMVDFYFFWTKKPMVDLFISNWYYSGFTLTLEERLLDSFHVYYDQTHLQICKSNFKDTTQPK